MVRSSVPLRLAWYLVLGLACGLPWPHHSWAAPITPRRYDLRTLANPATLAQRQDAYQKIHALVALQGIVNRHTPRLFFSFDAMPGYADLDQWWYSQSSQLEAFREILLTPASTSLSGREVADLIAEYRDELAGLVVWDPTRPATAHVASTLAGQENLIPVTPPTYPGSLCKPLQALGLAIRRDLAKLTPPTVTGSSKCDWYHWMLNTTFNKGGAWLDPIGSTTFTLSGQWQRYSIAGALDDAAGVTGLAVRVVGTGTVEMDTARLEPLTPVGASVTPNGSFENNNGTNQFTQWRFYTGSGGSGTLQVITDGHAGGYAARMTRTSASGEVVFDHADSKVPFAGGDAAQAQLFMRDPNGAGTQANVRLALFDASLNWIADCASQTFTLGRDWQRYRVGDTIDARAAYLFVAVRVQGTGTVDVDDVATWVMAPSGSDQARNGGMEINSGGNALAHWRFYASPAGEGTLSIAGNAHGGSSAARVSRTGFTGDVVLDNWDQPCPLPAGALAQATFWLRDPNNRGAQVQAKFCELGSGGTYLRDVTAKTVTLSGGWTQVTLAGQLSLEARAACLAFRVAGSTANAFDLDDVAITAMAPAGANLVPNGGMEANSGGDTFSGWRFYKSAPGNGTLQVATGAARGGAAARMTRTATGGDVVFDTFDALATVSGGDFVRARFRLRDPNAQNTPVEVKFFQQDPSGATWLGDLGTQVFTPAGTWGEYTISGRVAAGAGKLGLAFRVHNALGTVDIDEVQATAHEPDAGNLLPNPGMETQAASGTLPAGWRFYAGGGGAGSLATSANAHGGTRAALLTRTNAAGDVVFDNWDEPLPIAGQAPLTADFWLRDPNNAGTQLEARFFCADTTGSQWIGDVGSKTFTLTGTWNKYSIEGLTPGAAAFAGIAFRIMGTGSAAIDDVVLQQPAPRGVNLLPNPGLERFAGSTIDSWRFYKAVPGDATFQVMSDAWQGQAAARVIRSATAGDVVFDNWEAPTTVTARLPLRGDFYLRDPNNTGSRVEVRIFQMNAARQWIGDLGSRTFTLNNTWRHGSLAGSTMAGARFAGLAFRVVGTGTVDIDGIGLREAVGSGENLLLNPGMEQTSGTQKVSEWRFISVVPNEGSLAVSPSAYEGSAAARMTRSGSTGDVVFDTWDDCLVSAVGRQALQGGLWMRDPNNAGTRVEVRIFQTAGPARNFDPHYVGYYVDGHAMAGDPSGDWNSLGLINHDYLIARRGYLMDLSPWGDEAPNDDPAQTIGSDKNTFLALLDGLRAQAGNDMIKVFGFIPWNYKYSDFNGHSGHTIVDGEWESVKLFSSRNASLYSADAPSHVNMTNGSFWSRFHANETTASLNPNGGKPQFISDKETNYVCWMMGDYDSEAWMARWLPSLWKDDPQRGQLPLGWMCNPSCHDERAPHVLRLFLETRSAQDSFVTYEGLAYHNPNFSQNLDAIKAASQALYNKYGYLLTGSMITGTSYWLAPAAIDAYRSFSPAGVVLYGGQFWNPRQAMAAGKTPLSQISYLTGFNENNVSNVVSQILNNNRNNRFIIIHAIQVSPTFVGQVMSALNAGNTNERYRTVDPVTMMDLLRQNLGTNPNGTFDLRSDVNVLPPEWRATGRHATSIVTGNGQATNFNNTLKIQRTASGTVGAVDLRNNPVAGTPGKLYRVLFKAQKGSSSSAFANLEFLNGAGTNLGTGLSQNNYWGSRTLAFSDANWKRGFLMGYMPAGGASVSVALGSNSTGNLFFDNVALQEVTGNMLPNAGLEWNDGASGFDFWRFYTGGTGAGTLQLLANGAAYFGDASARMTRTRADVDVAFDNWDAAVPAMAGQHYRADFYLRDPLGAGTRVEAHLFQFGAFGTWVGDLGSTTFQLGSTWREYTIPWQKLSSSANYVGLALRVVGTGTVDIDALQIKSTAIQETPENLTVNPGLEVNDGAATLHGWRFYRDNAADGALAVLSSGTHQGQSSVRYTRTGTAGDVVLDQWNEPIPVDPTRRYDAHFYLRTQAPGQRVQVTVVQLDQNKALLGNYTSAVFTLDGTWTEYAIDQIAPATGAAYLALAFRTVGTGSFDLDDVTLRTRNSYYRLGTVGNPRQPERSDAGGAWMLYE